MKKYVATYYCGYSGTDDVHFIIANDEEQVASYMDEGLYDYAEGWTHLAFGWDNSYTDEDFEDFYQGCGYDIQELNDETFKEFCEDYGIDENDFEDIT